MDELVFDSSTRVLPDGDPGKSKNVGKYYLGKLNTLKKPFIEKMSYQLPGIVLNNSLQDLKKTKNIISEKKRQIFLSEKSTSRIYTHSSFKIIGGQIAVIIDWFCDLTVVDNLLQPMC